MTINIREQRERCKRRNTRANRKRRQQSARRRQRIQRRLDKTKLGKGDKPALTAGNIHYELSDRSRGMSYGGIGVLHKLARQIGLIDAIDRKLHLFKKHMPYHESDHVLNDAYNSLCDGDCLQDMELRRNDEVFPDALGAKSIPDPTTAGDFCRRFGEHHINTLQDVYDEVRIGVWEKQPEEFFAEAILEGDGTLVETYGECKGGMDISYQGTWGYHPLAVTLANTGEVMRIVNRSGNRPSHEGAAAELDKAIATCFRGGFQRVLLRGDTDFSQTKYLDGWDEDGRIRFHFGYDARSNLVKRAESLPKKSRRKLQRPPRYEVKTEPRRRPENVKDRKVRERGITTLRSFTSPMTGRAQPKRLSSQPTTVAIRRTCCRNYTAACALHAPVNNLLSNWAYMVMTALAWNLKAWWALTLPETPGRWRQRRRQQKLWVLRIEFKTFVNAFLKLPCQIIRSGRRIIYRLLSWNEYQPIFFRLANELRC